LRGEGKDNFGVESLEMKPDSYGKFIKPISFAGSIRGFIGLVPKFRKRIVRTGEFL